MTTNPALIGKAGELMVAAELMRRGIEVAYPASDVGVDLLAYRFAAKSNRFRFVLCRSRSKRSSGYNFQRSWFDRVPGVVLVHVWHLETIPEFYGLDSLARVEDALGPIHAASPSWRTAGGYSVTVAGPDARARMQAHRDRWERVIDQLSPH